MLHLTNGDCAADLIRQTGLPGTVVPWRDVLHEGPTPAGLSLPRMSEIRAAFITAQGWGEQEEVRQDFSARDTALARFREHERVVLWFEHDLYDQLQLIQILSWFAEQPLDGIPLELVCVGEFPGIERFDGLGQLHPDQIRSLFPARQPVAAPVLELGRAAWAAFCSPDPVAIGVLLRGDTSALPFLRDALLRHLQQFPSRRDGLSRTERQILEAAAEGTGDPPGLFRASQQREERVFMGDTVFWSYLRTLAEAREPLLRLAGSDPLSMLAGQHPLAESVLTLTDFGSEVLAGRADWVRSNGIDRWFGGVHLRGVEAEWRWDEAAACLVGIDA